MVLFPAPVIMYRSLSARRAWIEIKIVKLTFALQDVALRKESVDRNQQAADITQKVHKSLSARRAWIEIIFARYLSFYKWVALRKESVDRNILCGRLNLLGKCRSPQGERG